MKNRLSSLPAGYEIRPIKPATVSYTKTCTYNSCAEMATYYLVILPRFEGNGESRSRRCEYHARQSARSLGIGFPEV